MTPVVIGRRFMTVRVFDKKREEVGEVVMAGDDASPTMAVAGQVQPHHPGMTPC
jgi:hypothetical protein